MLREIAHDALRLSVGRGLVSGYDRHHQGGYQEHDRRDAREGCPPVPRRNGPRWVREHQFAMLGAVSSCLTAAGAARAPESTSRQLGTASDPRRFRGFRVNDRAESRNTRSLKFHRNHAIRTGARGELDPRRTDGSGLLRTVHPREQSPCCQEWYQGQAEDQFTVVSRAA